VILRMRFREAGLPGKTLYLFFELLLATYTVLILLPLVNMFLSSFKSTREIFSSPYALPREFRLDNYLQVWVRGRFGRYMLNSIAVTGLAMLLDLLLGSMAAFGIARYRYRLNTAIYLLFLSGIMLPLKAAVIPLFLLLKRLGLLNTTTSLVLVYAAMSLPSTVFILTGFMRGLPQDLDDAARIDGCSEPGIYWRVILPLVRPALAIVTIYNAIPIWNDFFFPLVFIQSDDLKTLPLGMTVFFGQYQTNWALLFTGLSIAILPMIALYLMLSKQFIQGLTAGAIK